MDAKYEVKSTMLRKIKYSKIAIVIFLTILIWVWADLALDETSPVPGATIIVAESSPNLWVSFGGKASTSIDNIVLKGPASKIAEIKREIGEGTLDLKFSLHPEWEGMTAAGPYPLNVLDFIKRSDELKELSGLTAESCEPNTITVDVVELVERPLTVQCIDESGNTQKYESISQSTVNMLVPSDWGRDKLVAQVKLTRNEIVQARKAPIDKIPNVELAAEQIREATTPVTIKLPLIPIGLRVGTRPLRKLLCGTVPTPAGFTIDGLSTPKAFCPATKPTTKKAAENRNKLFLKSNKTERDQVL